MSKCSKQKCYEAIGKLIYELNLFDVYKDLILNHKHTYSMVYDLFKRDHGDKLKKEMTRVALLTFFQKNDIFLDPQSLKGNNYFRLQYRYKPEEISAYCKRGASNARRARIDSGKPYNAKQTLEYWLKTGPNEMKAKENLENYKKSNSPKCVQFWTNKGLTEEEARTHISEKAVLGALGCLKVATKSKIEIAVENILKEFNEEFETQFNLKIKNIKNSQRKFLIFDFYLPKRNLLLEVNGTYWHCDPRFYSPSDIINLPENTCTAQDIWQRDAFKLAEAKSQNYLCLTVWETEVKKTEELKTWMQQNLLAFPVLK